MSARRAARSAVRSRQTQWREPSSREKHDGRVRKPASRPKSGHQFDRRHRQGRGFDRFRGQYGKETMIPLSAVAHFTQGATPLAVNHQGLLVANTISFNLPPNVSLSTAVTAIEATMNRIGVPATIRGTFQGTAKAFQDSLSNQPYLILAALITIYIVLGILYESYVHPLTILSTLPSAGVGALLALMAFRTEFSIMALIGVILLIGIVKKNAIMMIDFALDAERRRGLTPARCDLRSLPAPLQADHDDDHGCHAGRSSAGYRHGRRRRTSTAARYCHRRRTSRQSGADALYDAGNLFVYGSVPFMEPASQGRRFGTAGARRHATTGRVNVSKRTSDRPSRQIRRQASHRCRFRSAPARPAIVRLHSWNRKA